MPHFIIIPLCARAFVMKLIFIMMDASFTILAMPFINDTFAELKTVRTSLSVGFTCEYFVRYEHRAHSRLVF